MPTAVLDLELEQLPFPITVPKHYNRALILIRFRGQPVGQVWLSVINGHISNGNLQEELIKAVDWGLWERWLHNHLDMDGQDSGGGILPAATVAICTRDHPEDLRRCLEALMKLPDDGQEYLVIDNHPATDATRRLVAGYDCVRYVLEDRPGLDIARNRALREARHDIVVFTDDDTVPDPGWLRALLRNFNDPLVLCVTGLTMPLELETEAQEWSERYCPFGRGFSRVVFNLTNLNPLLAGRVGAGANMALHRGLLLQHVGLFDEALDAGTLTCSGGDTEMFSRIIAAGYQIVYEPAALSWHRHRRTWEELRKMLYGYGVGTFAWWTHAFVAEKEFTLLWHALRWFGEHHLRNLMASLLMWPGHIPLNLTWAEFAGALMGGINYFRSRRHLRQWECQNIARPVQLLNDPAYRLADNSTASSLLVQITSPSVNQELEVK